MMNSAMCKHNMHMAGDTRRVTDAGQAMSEISPPGSGLCSTQHLPKLQLQICAHIQRHLPSYLQAAGGRVQLPCW
jgi:hypothetical protein